MPMIEADDGTALYLKEWGDPEGPAVVLIHGWPLSADSWDDQALALADAGHHVISYDRRGFGRSDQPWDGYDYDTLADDLAAVIEACELDDPALVGFSMGGGEVARYLSRHSPARKSVLISSVVPFLLHTNDHEGGVPLADFAGMKDGLLADRAAFLQGFFRDFYGMNGAEPGLGGPVSEAQIAWSLQIALQAGLKATLDCLDSFAGTDFRPDLESFTTPTLIIHGTGDRTVPIDITARTAASAIPNATLLEYDAAPHGLLATHKDRVTRDLLAFLGE
jgi:pimeloyl-ACP methyl ester carboxylesterase